MCDIASIEDSFHDAIRIQKEKMFARLDTVKLMLDFGEYFVDWKFDQWARKTPVLAHLQYESHEREVHWSSYVLAGAAVGGVAYLFHRKNDKSRPNNSYHLSENFFGVGDDTKEFLKHKLRLEPWLVSNFRKLDTETFTANIAFSPWQIWTISPLNIEHILKNNFENYVDCSPDNDVRPEMFEYQNQQQAALIHRLFETSAIPQHIVFDVNDRLCGYVCQHLERTEGQPVDLLPLMQRYSMEMVGEIGLGTKFGFFDEKDVTPVQYRACASQFVNAFARLDMNNTRRFTERYNRYWSFFGFGLENQFNADKKMVKGFVEAFIRDRLQPNHAIGTDFISYYLLRDVDENELININSYRRLFKDNIEELTTIALNFLVTARESTAHTLCWCFYELSRNTESSINALRMCRAEIARKLNGRPLHHTDIEGFKYLRAVQLETLRLHPPVPYASKTALFDDILPDGTEVKQGNIIAYCPYAMGRSEHIWEDDVLEFKPERWLSGQIPSEWQFPVFAKGNRMSLSKNAYFRHDVIVMLAKCLPVVDFANLSYANRGFNQAPLPNEAEKELVFSFMEHMSNGTPPTLMNRFGDGRSFTDGLVTYHVRLTKKQHERLGLHWQSTLTPGRPVRVMEVIEGSVVHSYNRSCKKTEDKIHPGDFIVKSNGYYHLKYICESFRDSELRLTFCRDRTQNALGTVSQVPAALRNPTTLGIDDDFHAKQSHSNIPTPRDEDEEEVQWTVTINRDVGEILGLGWLQTPDKEHPLMVKSWLHNSAFGRAMDDLPYNEQLRPGDFITHVNGYGRVAHMVRAFSARQLCLRIVRKNVRVWMDDMSVCDSSHPGTPKSELSPENDEEKITPDVSPEYTFGKANEFIAPLPTTLRERSGSKGSISSFVEEKLSAVSNMINSLVSPEPPKPIEYPEPVAPNPTTDVTDGTKSNSILIGNERIAYVSRFPQTDPSTKATESALEPIERKISTSMQKQVKMRWSIKVQKPADDRYGLLWIHSKNDKRPLCITSLRVGSPIWWANENLPKERQIKPGDFVRCVNDAVGYIPVREALAANEVTIHLERITTVDKASATSSDVEISHTVSDSGFVMK